MKEADRKPTLLEAMDAGMWGAGGSTLDVSRLPATMTARPRGVVRPAVVILARIAAGIALFFGLSMWFRAEGPDRDDWALAAFLIGVPGAAAAALYGLSLRWPTERVVTVDGGSISVCETRGRRQHQWTQPLSAYQGLALRQHLQSRRSRPMSRSSGFGSPSKPVDSYWVELAHSDPNKRVILFYGKDSFSARKRLDHYAQALGLPILTTAGTDGR